eukprot:61943-Hanusia_phi.AAC.1
MADIVLQVPIPTSGALPTCQVVAQWGDSESPAEALRDSWLIGHCACPSLIKTSIPNLKPQMMASSPTNVDRAHKK